MTRARKTAETAKLGPVWHFRRPPATDEEVKQLRELPPGAGLAMSMRALSAAVLVAAAETSRPVYVFTPNSPAELRVALTVGADAVITDHVAIAVDLRRRLARGEEE